VAAVGTAVVGLAGVRAAGADEPKDKPKKGKKKLSVILIGPDGNMYYIPEDKLQAFKLADDKAKQVTSSLVNPAIRLRAPEPQVVPLLSMIRPALAKELGLTADNSETVRTVDIGIFRTSGD